MGDCPSPTNIKSLQDIDENKENNLSEEEQNSNSFRKSEGDSKTMIKSKIPQGKKSETNNNLIAIVTPSSE